MATFKRFEDIQAWQKARIIAKDVYIASGIGEFGRDFDLRSQIRRSGTSIMSNIAEGQGRRTDKDFAHFLNISLGSTAETKSHLYLALDLNYIEKNLFDDIFGKFDEVGRMIFALSEHLRGPRRLKTCFPSRTFSTSWTF
jgi:four helix bundle protein